MSSLLPLALYLLRFVMLSCAASSTSQPCSTVVQMKSLPNGLARATFLNASTPSSFDDDVTMIIGRNWSVPEGSCAEFQFSPGVYRVAPQNASVMFDVILTSNGTGVVISCVERTTNDSAYVLGFFKDQGSATLAGLTFINCTGSLVFDNLNYLTIANSTFRYIYI